MITSIIFLIPQVQYLNFIQIESSYTLTRINIKLIWCLNMVYAISFNFYLIAIRSY